MPDPTKLKVARHLDRPGICFGMARVPGTARVYYGASDAKVYEVDLAAEKPEPVELPGQHSGYVMGVALAGPSVVSGGYDGKLIWRDTATRTVTRTVAAHTRWIRGVVAAPDGRLIASVADDMDCKLWNAETGELVRTLQGHAKLTPAHFPSMLYCCAFSPDGAFLATADKVGKIVVWETATGQSLATLEAPLMYTWDPRQRQHSIGGIRSLAFSYDSTLLAVGGTGQIGNIDHLEALARVEVFTWHDGQRTHEFPGDKSKGLVEHMAFHPLGDWLVCAGGDHGGFVQFYDLRGNKLLHQDTAPMHVYDFSLNETLDTLYASGHGKLATFEFKA